MFSRIISLTSFIVVATVIAVVGGSALADKTPVNPELYGSWNLLDLEQAGMRAKLILIIEENKVTAFNTCSFGEYSVTVQTSSAAEITADEIRILESKFAREEYSPGFLYCTATLKAGKGPYQLREGKLVLTVSEKGETVELTRFGSPPRAAKQHKKSREQKLELAYTNRGTAYLKKGQYPKAIEEYNKALEINSSYAVAYYNRSVAYTSIGKYEKAVTDCNKALQLNPRHAKSYHNRGVSYWHLGSKDLAIKDFQAAAKLEHKEAQNFLKSMKIKW